MKARDLLNHELTELCKMYYYNEETPAAVADRPLPDDERADQLAEYVYMSGRFNPIDSMREYHAWLSRE